MKVWMLLTGLLALPAMAAPVEQAARVPGLAAPASITIDRWGIPHIRAASRRDAWFVQGWNAARDRLWQIDLWRKRGLGRLSASFGPDYVAQDRAARLFLYRGDMAAEWAAYAPGTEAMVTAFVGGINAYVDAVNAGSLPLPPEFAATASRPERWAPEDVVRIRSHALVSNASSEADRARIACVAGLDADRVRRPLSPAHQPVLAIDPCSVPADVLDVYTLATQRVSFQGGRLALGPPPDATAEGSNNWVVAPSRTASGRPLLANDPHRALGVPSLRYVVHVSAPGLDIMGAGEPALPGVSLGHNEDAAWGLTIFYIDQEDLYHYPLDPAHPGAYRHGSGWEAFREVRETIPVKGEAPRTVTLRFTRHGPVVWEDATQAYALKSVWASPGSAGYLQATWLTDAKDWDDFVRAHDHWGTPPLNLVFADRSGSIGWAASGLAPVRPNWDGLAPVPGDGSHEWQGFWTGAELPALRNPAKGWFATANEMNIPADYPAAARKLGYEWADRSRIDRIAEVLGANDRVSVADAMALQTDSHDPQAKRLQALAATMTPADDRQRAALSLLAGWDRNETTGSAAAALYQVWLARHLAPMVAAKALPPAALAAIERYSVAGTYDWLESPANAAARPALLSASLAAALDDLGARLGPDMAKWRWGDLHQALFVPAVAPRLDAAERTAMTLGPLPVPGSGSSPRAAGFDRDSFRVTDGASVRMVMDVGAWDEGRIINSPGQSGDPASRHYGDLFPLWAAGDYVPMLFSKAAVDAAAATVIRLSPR